MTIYRKGDIVPREWFRVYENVKLAIFDCDVIVTLLDNNTRYIEYADKESDDTMIMIISEEGLGAKLEFDIVTHFNTRR